ncbi:uncharacterized protein LOC119689400 [Teleopsis dalmanni]|uniref:uncharacterized protein LOC119689400 n=1 Tax=Teleopsis dalmanni TaxID=139649 RepID=UPI0018CDF2D2|nr:uncharacterized protein LOC119689400 [Teleopsis dalmanni]
MEREMYKSFMNRTTIGNTEDLYIRNKIRTLLVIVTSPHKLVPKDVIIKRICVALDVPIEVVEDQIDEAIEWALCADKIEMQHGSLMRCRILDFWPETVTSEVQTQTADDDEIQSSLNLKKIHRCPHCHHNLNKRHYSSMIFDSSSTKQCKRRRY